ncbi:MAG: hypothetical protein NVSMB9_23850 [Isosphaeraceae bacterium]
MREPNRALRASRFACLVALSLSSGCRNEHPKVAPSPVEAAPVPVKQNALPRRKVSEEPSKIRFRDATEGSGIDFVHCSGNSARKLSPTANGSGVAMIDYDGDGWLDLYFATTRNLPLDAPTKSKGNRL